MKPNNHKLSKATGRQSAYSASLADQICERIANGESLRAMCGEKGMPAQSTVFLWLTEHDDFAKRYAHSRDAQADVLFDEMLHIADTPLNGVKTVTKPNGVETVEGDMIEHRRLQIDARRWIIARLAPKKYGEKQAVEMSGPDGGPIATHDVTDEIRAKALLAFLAKTGGAVSLSDFVDQGSREGATITSADAAAPGRKLR
jgi:hypothetical protein